MGLLDGILRSRKREMRRYSEQRASLESQFPEVHVAVLDLFRGPRLGELTMATWGEGTVSMLPKADVVGFVASSGEMALVKWDDVMRLCEGLLRPVDGVDPVRFRTGEWPTDAQWAALVAVAVFTKGVR